MSTILTSLINIQYCYEYLVNQIPIGLLLYSHIPTAAAALVFGGFLLIRERKLPTVTLFFVCVFFALWCFFDLGSWFAFLGSGNMMFLWSLTDLFALVFFFFSYYFLYAFLAEKDLPFWHKLVGFALVVPTAVLTLLGRTLTTYDANTCEALEQASYATYPYFVEGFFLFASLVLAVVLYNRTKDAVKKRKIVLATTGIVFFLGFFFSSTLGVNYLVNDTAVTFAYNYEIYGLFGMPILLIYLGYLIVRYRAFHVKVFGAQALIFALLALIGSEFAFVNSITNRILVGISFIITALIGIILIRSVKREIEQRERIEVLVKDLEKSNKQQVALIHFITHQLKGFVGKSRNIFSMIMEGDYGTTPEAMKPILEEGFNSATKGAQTIQEILNAANIKNGKVAYANVPFDLKALMHSTVASLKPNADVKGLALTTSEPEGTVMLTGDQMQMENALKNLIDNSIKYTPTGSIALTLTSDGSTIRLVVQDTGVGITPEDMQHLFTEGGRGAESQKVNVDSTGFGLYIVKNIIEAHKGKVWAESEGAGKGSKFIVELPVSTA